MEIDIRDEKVGTVDCIRYGDTPSSTISDNGHKYILFEHHMMSSEYRVLVKKADIPNLIKALEKARELWGGE